MDTGECVDFLQWALPQLELRWQGFRRVRRQVCRRLDRRMAELGLGTLDEYREYIRQNDREWHILDRMCRITISRFYRDRRVFDCITAEVLPELLRQAGSEKNKMVRILSAGCASGEEPYTLAIVWHHLYRPHFPETDLRIVATEINPVMIARAEDASYSLNTLRRMPEQFLEEAFEKKGDLYSLKPVYRSYVRFIREDIRTSLPEGVFQAVFCRNLVFTYFALPLQQQILGRLSRKITAGGVLILGAHEQLPAGTSGFTPWAGHLPIYRKS